MAVVLVILIVGGQPPKAPDQGDTLPAVNEPEEPKQDPEPDLEPELEAEEEPEPEPEPEPGPSVWEQRLGTFPMAFGFTDSNGLQLILTEYEFTYKDSFDFEDDNYYDNTEEEEEVDLPLTEFSPNTYSLVIGPYGEASPINYRKWQDENAKNTRQDTAKNFSNLPGFIYAPADKQLSKDQTYVLTAASPLMDALQPLTAPGWKGNTPAMDQATLDNIKTFKDLDIEWGKVLARTRDGAQIGVVLYKRQGDDMLFSIVYTSESKTLFWDCPAIYDEGSTWQAGDKGQPGAFSPLLLASFSEGLMLALTWSGSESETVVLLVEENGAFMKSEAVDYVRNKVPA